MSISVGNQAYQNYTWRREDDDADRPGDGDPDPSQASSGPGQHPRPQGAATALRPGASRSGSAASPGMRSSGRHAAQQTPRSGVAPAPNTAPNITTSEAQGLLDRYEDTKHHPSDSDNANQMADLEEDSLRGMPPYEQKVIQQATRTNQQIDALPDRERGQYRAMLVNLLQAYESATTREDRQTIAKLIEDKVTGPVDTAYRNATGDPLQRARHEFRPPYGYGMLGAEGTYGAERLRQLGQQFDNAKTPAEREAVFAQAAQLRQTMQLRIQAAMVREKGRLDEQWAEADRELDSALKDARGLTAVGPASADALPYDRLLLFCAKALSSPRNAQEFAYRMQHDPQHFQELKDWHAAIVAKSGAAASQVPGFAARNVWDYYLRPGVRVPGPPLDITDTDTDTETVSAGNFAQDLQYRYQDKAGSIRENARMAHVVQQGGPMEREWVHEHMPPKPLWLARVEEGVGRAALGLIPGVNLFTDQLEPAPDLTSDEKFGIDLGSGIVAGMVGEMKGPGGRGGKAGEDVAGPKPKDAGKEGIQAGGKTGAGKGEVSNEKGGGGVHPPGEAAGARPGDAAVKPAVSRPGVRDVPDTYVSSAGGALEPDPQFRGIYRDSKGQGYIRQGDKTYAVSYDRDNGTWCVQSPDGGTKPPYPVRLNSEGNWEVNPETGLKGGSGRLPSFEYTEEGGKRAYEEYYEQKRPGPQIARDMNISHYQVGSWARKYASEHGRPTPPLRPGKYTDALGKTAYENYVDSCYTYEQVATDLGIGHETAESWVRKYARAHGREVPKFSRSEIGVWPSAGPKVYEDLRSGRTLEQAAKTYTHGNTRVAYRGAMNYVQTGLDTHGDVAARESAVRLVREAQAKQLALDTAAAGTPPSTSRMVLMELQHPMTSGQYDTVRDLYDKDVPPADIAQKVGLPEASVKAVVRGDGYYSNEHQAYIEPISDRDTWPAEQDQPPAKRPRVDEPGPSGSQPGPSGLQPGTASPAPATPQSDPSSSPPSPQPSPAAPDGGAAPSSPHTPQMSPPRTPSPVEPEIVWTTDNVPQWGRAELRMALDPEHAGELAPLARKAIVDWIDGKAPAPQSLQMELYEQGFFGLTPSEIRQYFRPDLQPPLTPEQVSEVNEWLNSFD
ncbi:hypothetical protein V4C53_06900 [Paraburkholderia azotifigens]|uniref:hypothetical protein n=1 Tax=Paraburkholderia azotifigens TaxID=2057004 RepID=UPI00316E78CF